MDWSATLNRGPFAKVLRQTTDLARRLFCQEAIFLREHPQMLQWGACIPQEADESSHCQDGDAKTVAIGLGCVEMVEAR